MFVMISTPVRLMPIAPIMMAPGAGADRPHVNSDIASDHLDVRRCIRTGGRWRHGGLDRRRGQKHCSDARDCG
jgi:hypothetical protein